MQKFKNEETVSKKNKTQKSKSKEQKNNEKSQLSSLAEILLTIYLTQYGNDKQFEK